MDQSTPYTTLLSISDEDMLAMAPRLALAGNAKFKILATNETVLPGKVGKKITLRLKKSGKTIERLPKEIALLTPPPAAGRAAHAWPNLRTLP